MHSTFAVVSVYLAGCALLLGALRYWRPSFPWRAALAHGALTTAFFAQPLFTGALQVPTDIAYELLPLREAVAGPVTVRNPLLADTLLEQVPFHALVRERLLAGELPLWAHELGTGQPLLGNGQSAPFAPLHLMALPLAAERAQTVVGAWQILVGLLLVHALLLRLGAGPWGAGFGAVAAGFSTYAVIWSYDTPGMAAAFVPGVLLGILLLRDEAPRALPGLVACGLGLALSGHPETMAHAAVVAAVVAGVLWLRRPSGRGRFVARLSLAAALTAGFAAPALLPFLAVMPESTRGQALEESPENFQPPPFTARFVLPTFAPLALGSVRDGTYVEKWSYNEIGTQYAGMMSLALAATAVTTRRRFALVLLLGGLLALLVALRIGPFFDLAIHLPVVGAAAKGRLREYWVLAVALAGGLALEAVPRERAVRLAALVTLSAAALVTALAPHSAGAFWPDAWWLVTLAGVVAAGIVMALPRLRNGFAPVACGALVLDLFLLGVRYQPVMPEEYDLAPTPTISFLMEQARQAPEPFRVSFKGFGLPPNLGALYGLADPRGYDPMRPYGAAHFVGWRFAHQRNFLQIVRESLALPDPGAHDYLAVRFFGAPRKLALPAPWRLVLDGKGGKIWENPNALPLFFVPRAVQSLAEPQGVVRAALRHSDFAGVALVRGPGGPPVAQSGQVSGLRILPNGYDLTVDSPAGALVVSSVSYVAGWHVQVGDGEAEPLSANSGFLAFRVPAGHHAVELRYRAPGFVAGLGLAGLAFVGSGALALAGRRGRFAAPIAEGEAKR